MINQNKIQKENNSLDLPNYEPLRDELSKILENQRINKKKQDQILETIQRGFIGLASRNEDLLKSNDQLKQQLDGVLKELNAIKQEREEKAARKEAWVNRKRLPKRDPMTAEIYRELMRATEGPTYINLRTRMALYILAVTRIRINELVPLKVSQLETVFKENWIAIDRSKRGLSNHKAFLTKEGKKTSYYLWIWSLSIFKNSPLNEEFLKINFLNHLNLIKINNCRLFFKLIR